MDFKFNDIKVKQLKEDFNFNDISTDKEVSFSDEFVDTFLEKFRLECYKYYREIFKGIEEHNIDVIKNDHSLNITLHANLLILRTDESTIKFPINHFVGSLVIDESCTNITKFDDSFPRCVTNRLTIRNHITNYKKCPDAHSIVINDKQLTEFDFDQLKHINNNHFLWFHVYDPSVLSNFKNAAKFLNEHSYTNITVISPAEVNLIEVFGVDEKYYQYESNEVSEGEWQLFLNHRCCEAIPLNDEWKELKENIEFDSIQSTSINDNVITGMYKQKVKKELLNILERYYTTSFFKHVLVTFSNSTFEDYDFDIKYVNCELSNPDEILIGRVRIKTSGIIDKLEVCKFVQSKVMNSVESAPEISTFLYNLVTSDFYFNEVHICADSNLCFYFDSFNDYIRLDIKCNFPFKELKEKIKSVTFGFNNDIVSKDDDLLGGIDVYDSATLLFGYGEMHFRKDKEEHMKDIGHLDEFKEFWDVVKIFNVDPQYGIHFIADEQPYKKPYKTFGSVTLTEDVNFDKVLNGNIDYDSMIYNVSLMNDLLKKFKSVNESYLKNTQKKLHINGYNVIDQFNDLWFSVLFDDEIYKIKSITFYKHECISYGPYVAYNIFNTLCFINELDKYQIETIEFCERKEYHPYVLKNNFFDIVDNSVNHIIDLITKFKHIEKDKQNPDIWYKQCQKLYPISECFKNIKNIIFNANGAKLLMIDDSVAFKNENDYNNFVQKLLGGLTIENYSYYGDKLAEKPKFVTESVDFDKVNDGKVNYDVVFHNLSMMNDILKKFEFINQSYISNNNLELKVKGFDVVDQDNQKMFSVVFDNEPYKIKLITFYQYETYSFGIYAQVNNIFGYLCFISELDKYQIESVMFYQDKKNGVVPYIIRNDFFDLIDDGIDHIVNLLTQFKNKNKKELSPDTWFKQCQRLYPVSEGLKNLKTINFHDYTAELIIDDSIAFKDEADYNNFVKKLSLITKVENCSFYGEKLRDKPKFVR